MKTGYAEENENGIYRTEYTEQNIQNRIYRTE